MIIESNDNETIIRISPNVNLQEIQQSLDFIRYKEIISKSRGTQKNADDLAEQSKNDWWKENKAKYIY